VNSTLQVMVGIPYITAPMEAEGQCVAPALSKTSPRMIRTYFFGGARVYKNLFNQSKTVECFFLADFARELGIDREKLVQLAYLPVAITSWAFLELAPSFSWNN